MATVVVTLKIMPESPETDLKKIESDSLDIIKRFAGDKDTKIETEPIAFGLKALKILFAMDESKGSPDEVEDQIRNLEGVMSVEITDVRRAIG